jgi:hypothetical protein
MKVRLMEHGKFHGIPWNFVNWRNLMEFGFDRAWASDRKVAGSNPDWTVTIFWAPLPWTGSLVSV